jgi:Spy/CpxP family protein refolding chaperone
MMAMGPGMGPGPDMMFMHHGHADPEKRAQRLRDVLQLRPDQDGALKAFVDATSPKLVIRKERSRRPTRLTRRTARSGWSEPKPMTTLERLDHMTKAADAIKKRAEATRAFYTALTPSQQKTFDVLGMGEGEGGQHIFVRRFDTRGPAPFKGGERKGRDRAQGRLTPTEREGAAGLQPPRLLRFVYPSVAYGHCPRGPRL